MSLVSHEPFQLSGRYANLNRWEVLNGPGDARPTGTQIIKEEGLEADVWSDKVILITGVSAGIGIKTFEAIASTGATVFGTARNLEKAKQALGPTLERHPGRCHLLHMDQADLATVRACADAVRTQSGGKLNVIINNAAVMNTPYEKTKDGFELQFQTNHLSHFLLFYLLKDLLLTTSASTPNFNSRVVTVSSAAHRYGPCRLDNINFDGDGVYNGWLAYGSSKTANIYMTNQIERLYGAQGLHAYSVHPGGFISPNLQKFSQAETEGMANGGERVEKYMTSQDQACATSVYGAVSSELEGRGGLYLEGASMSSPCPPEADAVEYGYGSWAYDKENEEQLWEMSKKWAHVE
ncbi:hypothetical protein NM208_g4055 [Fusarium decemcellulare]|uniref:Uncharacterized protein n=1 Tax=Fusarium decemcellulare TaxID=57161 RepID=A0ACC1SLX5_9HYPO|nr:hypothetical protein NM208_g4055 [Fusarium decemcellulare]